MTCLISAFKFLAKVQIQVDIKYISMNKEQKGELLLLIFTSKKKKMDDQLVLALQPCEFFFIWKT